MIQTLGLPDLLSAPLRCRYSCSATCRAGAESRLLSPRPPTCEHRPSLAHRQLGALPHHWRKAFYPRLGHAGGRQPAHAAAHLRLEVRTSRHGASIEPLRPGWLKMALPNGL